MLGFLQTALNEISSHGKIKSTKPNKVPNYVYRDELEKKPSSIKRRKGFCAKPESKPLLQRSEEDEKKNSEMKRGLKVKIVMTKSEAARLLSKCKHGGVLEFGDVARELVQIPVNRVTVLCPSSDAGTCKELETIPEEL